MASANPLKIKFSSVDCRGIEPRFSDCKSKVVPLDQQPFVLFALSFWYLKSIAGSGIEPDGRPYESQIGTSRPASKISLTPALPRFGVGCISPAAIRFSQIDSDFDFGDAAWVFLLESEFLQTHIVTESTTRVGWQNQMFVRCHWPIELKIVSQSSVAPVCSSMKKYC